MTKNINQLMQRATKLMISSKSNNFGNTKAFAPYPTPINTFNVIRVLFKDFFDHHKEIEIFTVNSYSY